MVIKSEYLTKLYIYYSVLESIFIKESNIYKKIVRLIDKLIKYDYKVHHQLYKANIIWIVDRISCFPIKYSQHITAVDLEKMVFITTSYTQFFILSIKSIDYLIL